MPDDLVRRLEELVVGKPIASEMEHFYTDQQLEKESRITVHNEHVPHYDSLNGGSYMDYMNSTRGVAFSALMAALRGRGEVERQWHWLERMTNELSDALRAGAVQELISIEPWDADRAWPLFTGLLDGHPEVLRSHFVS